MLKIVVQLNIFLYKSWYIISLDSFITVHFDQFNAPLLNKCINMYFLNKIPNDRELLNCCVYCVKKASCFQY